MAESSTPGWASSTLTSSSRPGSTKSGRFSRSQRNARSDEQTPLLHRDHDAEDDRPATASSHTRSVRSQPSKRLAKRWPSLAALLLLCVFVVLIMLLGFVFPEKIQDYAMQAMVFEPTSLSIDSFTDTGVKARVQGNFKMDASRVGQKSVRDLGRFGTWLAREVESGKTKAEVYLPEYGNLLLGSATVPGIKVDVRNGHTTYVDVIANVEPGDTEVYGKIARDWMDKKLDQIRVIGKAHVAIKSGLIHLPQQTITQDMIFKSSAIPTIPAYNITRLIVHEVDLPDNQKGMQADVSVVVENSYPIDFTAPPLGFGILVDNCEPGDPYIMVADAITPEFHIRPNQDLHLNVSGIIRKLPEALTAACPGSHKSPLDSFVGDYIHGDDATVYVRGSDSPSTETPKWITDLMADVTVPISVAGKDMGNLVRNFTMSDVQCSLPDPFAEPGTPDAWPKVSAIIKVLVALPEMINFSIDVSAVRANADMYYKGKKLGKLKMDRWQKAKAARTEEGLEVQSKIDDAPLEITDDDLFSEVVQALLFGNKPVMMEMRAEVDVKMVTALGKFAINGVPAKGLVPVKPITKPGSGDKPGGGFLDIMPKVSNMQIVDTTEDSMTMEATVNVTNPTTYSATIPFIDILVMNNGSVIGHATLTNQSIKPGLNEGLVGRVLWRPVEGGKKGKAVGKELLSQIISGDNATLTLKTFNGTLPSQPGFGRALSAFPFTIPFPKIHNPSDPSNPTDPPPDDDDDDDEDSGMHLIKEATMHLVSQTATFLLSSPFQHTTLYITRMNATSFYQPQDRRVPPQPVGHILYELPFAVPPGESESPHLPVEFVGGLGYEALKKAIGGELRLSAYGECGIRIGLWREEVWVRAKGIGSKVRW